MILYEARLHMFAEYRGWMKGDITMAYETKVILKLLANAIGNAETIEEAYEVIAEAASVEDLTLPSYDEVIERRKEKRK